MDPIEIIISQKIYDKNSSLNRPIFVNGSHLHQVDNFLYSTPVAKPSTLKEIKVLIPYILNCEICRPDLKVFAEFKQKG